MSKIMSYLHFDVRKCNNSRNASPVNSVVHFPSFYSLLICLALIMIHIVVTTYAISLFFTLLKWSLDSSTGHHLECILLIWAFKVYYPSICNLFLMQWP